MGLLGIKTIVLSMCATNCYILYDDNTKEGFIIDPADSPDKIIDLVTKLQIDVKALLLTHGHFDHIMGIDKTIEEFGDMPVYIEETDLPLLTDVKLNL